MDLREMKKTIYDSIYNYLVEGGFEPTLERELSSIAEERRYDRAFSEVAYEIGKRGNPD